MGRKLAVVWIVAVAFCGCQFSTNHGYPDDPLLLSKKPVKGKTEDWRKPIYARADPEPPAIPESAVVSASLLSHSITQAPPQKTVEIPTVRLDPIEPLETTNAVTATPVSRPGGSPTVKTFPAVRRKSAQRFDHAPDFSWIQGVLVLNGNTFELQYGEPGTDDRWGGKLLIEDDSQIKRFKAGDVIYVEGTVVSRLGINDSPRYLIHSARIADLPE